jgi:hypothetical protein
MVQHAWVFVLLLLAAVVFALRTSHSKPKYSHDANKGDRRSSS